jgi:hypothetical protein
MTTEATLTPTQKDAVEKVKALQRLTTATGFISKRSVGEILGKLTAEIESLKALATTQPEPVTQPDSDTIAQKLAQIRGRITVSDDLSATPSEVVPPPPTEEEIALEAERAEELKRQQQELITARKLQAEIEHESKLATIKKEMAAVEEANEKEYVKHPELRRKPYKPLSTDGLAEGFQRPKTWSKW